MSLCSSCVNSLRLSSMAQPHLYIVLLWAAIAAVHPSTWNVALYKPAYQISTNCSCAASRATDGQEFVKYNNSTCSLTKDGERMTWWMVDLLGVYLIEEVQISNIGDYRSEWLVDFRIDVFFKDPRLEDGFPGNKGQLCYLYNASSVGTGRLNATCKAPLLGRFVRIIKNNSYALILCEVNVTTKTYRERYVSYRKWLVTAVELPLPFKIVALSSKLACAESCTDKRDKDKCWGFYWVPSQRKCHLLAPAASNSSLPVYESGGGILYVENSLADIQMRGNC